MKLIYIAGPMGFRRHIDYNFPAFDHARDFINSFDHLRAISPADMDRDCGFDGRLRSLPTTPDFTIKSIINRDVTAIMECDGIYMLDGWLMSVGAQAERRLAIWLGIPVFYEGTHDSVLEMF